MSILQQNSLISQVESKTAENSEYDSVNRADEKRELLGSFIRADQPSRGWVSLEGQHSFGGQL